MNLKGQEGRTKGIAMRWSRSDIPDLPRCTCESRNHQATRPRQYPKLVDRDTLSFPIQ